MFNNQIKRAEFQKQLDNCNQIIADREAAKAEGRAYFQLIGDVHLNWLIEYLEKEIAELDKVPANPERYETTAYYTTLM